jgi:hypothetical protein
MSRHLWADRGNSVWALCCEQEFDSARVKVLAFATWYALVCENRTDDDTSAGSLARDGGDTLPPDGLYDVTLSADGDAPPWSAYPDSLLDGDPGQSANASSCADDAQVLELTEQGWWWGSGWHLADKTEGAKAKLCHIIPPSPRTAKLQARRQRGTGKSEFRCYPTAALDNCVLNATAAGVDALMRLSCANADCAEQLEWMEQQVLALQNLKQEQEAEIQGFKNQKVRERQKILEREREERQKRADCTRFLLEQLHAREHTFELQHASKSTHPEQTAYLKSEQPTEQNYKGHVRMSSAYLMPYTPLASEVLQVKNGPWQGARFRCGEMSG